MEQISKLQTIREIFTARGDKVCDRFEDVSMIRTTAMYHIYNIGKTLQSRKEPNNDYIR